MILVAVPALLVIVPFATYKNNQVTSVPEWALLPFIAMFATYEIVLLSWTGQTLGKMLTGVRVAQLVNGRRPDVSQVCPPLAAAPDRAGHPRAGPGLPPRLPDRRLQPPRSGHPRPGRWHRGGAQSVSAAIEIRGLRKAYGDTVAVRDIDLVVQPGEILALLGPNGAGKTTTVEILEGFRPRDAGSVAVLGIDPAEGGRALRERVGIVLQSSGIDQFLTVREVLALYAGYYPRSVDIDELLETVGLSEKAGSRVRNLSGGQQRRVDLALGTGGRPRAGVPRRAHHRVRSRTPAGGRGRW